MGALVTLLIHALIGWGLCGAAMGLGMKFLTLRRALIVHAVAAPIFFTALTWSYLTWFGDMAPFRIALTMISVVIVLDVFVVALAIERSFEMFKSPLGTWIPFALIFAAAWVTGSVITAS